MGQATPIWSVRSTSNPDSYLNGTDWADNESMYAGEDNDTNRTTYCPVPLPADYVPDHTPMQDTPGTDNIYTLACPFR